MMDSFDPRKIERPDKSLLKYYAISCLLTVDTAGGGQPKKDAEGHQSANFHQGVIEGDLLSAS